MRDPGGARRRDPRLSRSRERLHGCRAGRHRRRCRTRCSHEMKARIKEDDSSVPAPDGPWAYYTSYVTGGQYPRIVPAAPRRRRHETVLLDGNVEAEGKPYWQLGGAAHSPDHRLLAYAVDDKGSELYTIRIRDLATGQDLADAIPGYARRRRLGGRQRARCSTSGSTTTTGRCTSTATRVGTPVERRRAASTRRPTTASTSASARRSRRSSSSSTRTTTRRARST